MKKDSFKLLKVASSISVILTLAACSKSGGDAPSSPPEQPPPPPPPAESFFNVTVIDGYIRGAIAYIDLNNNKTRDADEPFTETVEGGAGAIETTGLELVPEDVSVIVDIPAGAVDESTISDENPNGVPITAEEAFQLVSLPGETVATPLTTLVSLVAGDDTSVEEAKAAIALSLGITTEQVSSDYIADVDAVLTVLTEVMIENELIPKNVTTNVTGKDVVIAKSLTTTIAKVIQQASTAGTLENQKDLINSAGKAVAEAAKFVNENQAEELVDTNEATLAQIVDQVGSVVSSVYNQAIMSQEQVSAEELDKIALKSKVVANASSANIVSQAMSEEGLSEQAITKMNVASNVLSNIVQGLIDTQSDTTNGLDDAAVEQIESVSQIIANVVTNITNTQSSTSSTLDEQAISNIQTVATAVTNTVEQLFANASGPDTNVSAEDIASIASLIASEAIDEVQALVEGGLTPEEVAEQLEETINESASDLEDAAQNDVDIDDLDGDGIANDDDPDIDNDGVANEFDAFRFDETESVDTDFDGIGNNADTDDDGDNVVDTEDAFPLDNTEYVDTDGDGVGNNADEDDDNDGVNDADDINSTDPTQQYGGLADIINGGTVYSLSSDERSDLEYEAISVNTATGVVSTVAYELSDTEFPLDFIGAPAQITDSDDLELVNGEWQSYLNDHELSALNSDGSASFENSQGLAVTIIGQSVDLSTGNIAQLLSSANASAWGNNVDVTATFSADAKVYQTDIRYDTDSYSIEYSNDCITCNAVYVQELSDYARSLNSIFVDARDEARFNTDLPATLNFYQEEGGAYLQLELIASDTNSGPVNFYVTGEEADDGVYIPRLISMQGEWRKEVIDEVVIVRFSLPQGIEALINLNIDYESLENTFVTAARGYVRYGAYREQGSQEYDGVWLNEDAQQELLASFSFDDTNNNNIADAYDNDDDSDGVYDSEDAFPRNSLYSSDIDNDGIADEIDTDVDGDGVANELDVAPQDSTIGSSIAITSADLASAYITYRDGLQSDLVAATETRTEEFFSFADDGSGEMSSFEYANQSYSWTLNNGAAVLTYDTPPQTQGTRLTAEELFERQLIDAQYRDNLLSSCSSCSYEVYQQLLSTTLELLNSDDQNPEFYRTNLIQQSIEPFDSQSNSNVSVIDSEVGESLIFQNIDTLASTAFVAADVVGQWVVPTHIENNSFITSDIVTFNADGSASSLLTQSSFTWSINASGSLEISGQVEGTLATVVITELEEFADGKTTLMDVSYGGEHHRGHHFMMAVADIDLTFNLFDQFLMSGATIDQPAFRDENGQINVADYFGFYFNDDGLAARVFGNTIINGGEHELRAWNQDANGLISMSAYRSNDGIDQNTCTRDRAESCVLWRTRYWQPVNQVGERLYVLEWEDYYQNIFDAQPVFTTLIPPRIRYYEVFDYDFDFINNRGNSGDADGDGIIDASDAFPFDNREWLDTDNDGTGNNTDTDDDNDGVADWLDDLPLDNGETLDTDGDGIGNNTDPDDDNDGVADIDDIAPLDTNFSAGLPFDASNLSAKYAQVYKSALAQPSVATNYITQSVWSFSNNQGNFYSDVGVDAFDFAFDNNKLSLSFPNASVNVEGRSLDYLLSLGLFSQSAYDAYLATGGQSYVEVNIQKISTDLWLVEDADTIDTFIIANTTQYSFVDDALNVALLGDTNSSTIVTNEAYSISLFDVDAVASITFNESDMVGAWGIPITLESAGDALRVSSDYATFNADNTGVATITGEDFTWEVINGELVITYSNGDVITMTRLEIAQNSDVVLVSGERNGQYTVRLSLAVKDSGTADITGFTEQFLINSFGISNPNAYDENGDVLNDFQFGYILQQNGTGTNIINGEFDIAENRNSTPRFWLDESANVDGNKIIITANVLRDSFGNVIESFSPCEPNGVTCLNSRQRHWQLLQETESRIYVLEWAQRNDNATDPNTIEPSLRTFIAPRVQFYTKFVIDTDQDGMKDDIDTDDDNDGVLDDDDAFPFDVTESVDTDLDGIGNNADNDDDNDGVFDDEDAFPLDPSESHDYDLDGIGDFSDPDDDNDGVNDVDDIDPFNPELGAILPLSADDLVGAYVWNIDSALSNPSVSIRAINGAQYVYFEDNTGLYVSHSSVLGFSWSVNNNVLTVEYTEPSLATSFLSIQDLLNNGFISQLEFETLTSFGYSSALIEVSSGISGFDWLLADTDNAQQTFVSTLKSTSLILQADVNQVLYGQSAGVEQVLPASQAVQTLLRKEDVVTTPFDEVALIGSWSMNAGLRNNDSNGEQDLTADILLFNDDATGFSKLTDMAFTWSIDAQGALLVSYTDISKTVRLQQFETFDNGIELLSELVSDGADSFERSVYSVAVKVDDAVDVDFLKDKFLMSAVTLTDQASYDENNQILSERYFGFRLESNGKSTRVISRDLDISQDFVGWGQYFWQQSDDGTITLDTRRIANTANDCYLAQNSQCLTYRQRHWIPLKRVGDRLWVLEWLLINRNNDIDDSLFDVLAPPRTNFYNVFDIDSDADGLLDKDDDDIDADGITNENDAFPFDTNESIDSDGDQFSDNVDRFPFDATEWFDTDNDGTGNNADTDDDGDGVEDDVDTSPLIFNVQ